MPDLLAEYNAALTGAALFDCSDAAKLELTGPDAAMFLGNLCTNDIKKLGPDEGCEAYFCDPRAKVKFQAWIYVSREPRSHWVETTPGRGADLMKYLDRYLISERVELADRTADFAQFHVAGPKSFEIIRNVLRLDEIGLAEFQQRGVQFGIRAKAVLRRRDPLEFPGYDILVRSEWATDVTQLLTDAGAVPASREVFETLRIEAGMPLFGPDIDENRFVMEVAHAARAVSYTKGCFLGQEPIVMARDRAGHVNRAFLGLKVLEGGPLPAGAKLFRDGQEVGVVTSSCHSPRLNAPIALGYLRWKHQEVGTRMEAETPVGRQPVEVLGMPPVR